MDNLPSHTHNATTASHSHTQPVHTHIIDGYKHEIMEGPYLAGAGSGGEGPSANPSTSSSGGETTGSASPITTIGNTGKGTSFNIMPPYIAINIWKRLS